MGGFIPHARFVTMIILTINCGLYLATVVFSAQNGGGLMSVDGRTLFEFGAKYRLAILGYGAVVAAGDGGFSARRAAAYRHEFVGAVRSGRAGGGCIMGPAA